MCHISQRGIFWMKFHTNFSQKKHKIEKIWFGIEMLCVISLKEVSSEWNFILISAKKSTKLRKFDLELKTYDFELKSYTSYVSRRYPLNEISYTISTNNQQKIHEIMTLNWRVMIWNWGVTRHISQGAILWMKIPTNLSQK